MNSQTKMMMEPRLSFVDLHKRIAPWLIDCDFAKEVASLQLFSNPLEGEIFHILLVGDPASAKSDLLKEVNGLDGNSGWVGQRTTVPGLIEELERSDGGILCAEEFDKTEKKIRNNLLEVMEIQKTKVTMKTFNDWVVSRTNILATCNPRGSMLNDHLPLHMQLTFAQELPLLTRFALIVPFKALGGTRYREVAISHNYDREQNSIVRENLKREIMRLKRGIPRVIVSDELAGMSGDFIAELKDVSKMKDIITVRLVVNGFKSALKARARMNYRSTATKEDFNYIKKIFDRIYFPEGGF